MEARASLPGESRVDVSGVEVTPVGIRSPSHPAHDSRFASARNVPRSTNFASDFSGPVDDGVSSKFVEALRSHAAGVGP